jgi:hypothetical protein
MNSDSIVKRPIRMALRLHFTDTCISQKKQTSPAQCYTSYLFQMMDTVTGVIGARYKILDP